MKCVFVYNSQSGSALSLPRLKALVKQHDIEVEKWIALDSGAWRKKLVPFIEKGATIAAYGGDGTLSAVVQLLVGTKAIFLPLPGGTLNHFTKDLRIPQTLDQALAHLNTTKQQTIDIAQVNERLFINNASIGLYPLSLRQRDHLEGRIGKWPAVLLAGINAFIRFRLYNVTINDEHFQTPFIFVGNNTYQLKGLQGVDRQSINQGTLSVYSIRASSRFTLLKIIFLGLFKRARYLHEFQMYKIDQLVIKAKRSRLYVSYDGEVGRLRTPLRFKIIKKGVRIRY